MPGGCYFHHNDSFLMVRGRHLDLALMGAFEVSRDGDLANWVTSDPDAIPAVGGAMDLAAGAREVRILMEHTTKEGAPRIRDRCTYPLTAPGCVKRVYTNLAVLDIAPEGIVVREIAQGFDLASLQRVTEPMLTLANDWRILAVPAGISRVRSVAGDPEDRRADQAPAHDSRDEPRRQGAADRLTFRPPPSGRLGKHCYRCHCPSFPR